MSNTYHMSWCFLQARSYVLSWRLTEIVARILSTRCIGDLWWWLSARSNTLFVWSLFILSKKWTLRIRLTISSVSSYEGFSACLPLSYQIPAMGMTGGIESRAWTRTSCLCSLWPYKNWTGFSYISLSSHHLSMNRSSRLNGPERHVHLSKHKLKCRPPDVLSRIRTNGLWDARHIKRHDLLNDHHKTSRQNTTR